MEAIVIFILSFLGINFLVFIPSWLVGLFSKIDHPQKSFFDDTTYFIFKKLLFLRFSDDCFRFILELQTLTFLLLLLHLEHTYFLKLMFVLLITLSFIYVTYISVIIKIFKKEAMLINDINFAKTGIMVFKKMIPIALVAVFLCVVIVVILSNYLSETLINSSLQIEQKWLLSIPLGLSIVLSLISVKKVNYDIYHSCVSFSVFHHLFQNLKKCHTLKSSLKTLNKEFPYAYAEKIKLKKRPNIIFIFLESYGSFVFSEPKHGEAFKKKMNSIHLSLRENGFKTVSTLSESPVSSGGSWLSHSSVLFGAKVRDIAAHEMIFSQTDYVSKLASLPKYLGSYSYKSTLTTTMSYHKNEINWEKVNNAYPFDKMMLHDDFEYIGQKVNIYGDTFTLPDEYTLNYAYDTHINKSPFFLCVNAINSHHKFVSPIKVKDHWKDYNKNGFQVTDGLKKNNLKNYFTAINYQLDYIHKFFLNNNLDDTITVLIGDHQPPFITPANIDKATPVHIISKNNDVINAFKEFNFTQGLTPTHQTQKHESLFSKLLYVLNRAYGDDKNLELPIFEDGIHLY